MPSSGEPAVRPRWERAGPRRAFRWTAFVLAVTSFSAAIPTPLYPGYAARFGFSAGVLGGIFAAYTPGVLLTLFLLAPRAESIGRRPLLAAGMVLTMASAGLFATANGPAALAVARFVMGLAVGATTSVANAAMTDLEPYRDAHHVARVAVAANFGGYAVGVLASGVVLAVVPGTMTVPFVLPVVAAASGLIALSGTPETAAGIGRPAPPERPELRADPPVRSAFVVAAGGLAACYAIYGLFGALVPSYLRSGPSPAAPLVDDLVVALMFGLAALIQLGTAQLRDRRALLVGLPLLLVGLVALVIVLPTHGVVLVSAVAAALGLAVGLTFMGSDTLIDRVAPPRQRGALLAAFYSVGYVALAVPTIGVAETSIGIGLSGAAAVFGGLLALVVVGLFVLIVRTPTPPGGGGRPRSPTGPSGSNGP